MKLIVKTLALGAALFMVGCSTYQNADRPEADLSKTVGITAGMNQESVLQIMGLYPQKTEISDGITEWHYCDTGMGMDEFVAIYFSEGKVVAMKNYQATLAEVDGATGHCSMFVKRGNYREPDMVADIRLRYSRTRY